MNQNRNAYLREATSLHLEGRFDEAENIYRSLLTGNELSAAVHNNLAFLLSQQGKYEEAIAEYQRAIAVDPGYATAYANFGQTLLILGRYDECGEMLLKAFELDPSDFHTNKSLAKFSLVKGDPVDAEKYLKNALATRNDPELLLDLSWCLFAQGKLEEAANALNYAEETEKGNPRFQSMWGVIHYAANNFGQAIHHFRQSLGLEPENIETRNSLVACLLKIGEMEEARREMHRILLMHPGHVESLNNLAVLELAADQTELSNQYLDKVLEQDKKNEKALYYKAIICIRSERKNEAQALLNIIKELPGSSYADKAREALELISN